MTTTDLTSISTNGWFSSVLSDNLTPVSTFGWYYFDEQTPVSFSYSIPIEIFGKTQFWILNQRGVLWNRDNSGDLWKIG